MFIKKNIPVYLLISMMLPLCFSCKKNLITTSTSAKLSFQTDTVKFDTVFTTEGSATQSLIIYNPNSEKINVSNIRLGGGTTSQFRMNVDGTPTYSINNVQIAAHDSLHIFVAVTVNPQNINNPFLVTDSILFTTNGNNQKVILDAYGQNAHYFNGDSVCNVTWTNDKPYVIINSLLVPAGCTLTIDPGVHVYMHYGSSIFVEGKLIVGDANNPTDSNSVVIKGDRLEEEYSEIPGQWGGIVIFRKSNGNSLTHTKIDEASYGIIIGDFPTDTNLTDYNQANEPDITLNECIVKNCLYDGIYSSFSQVTATNSLIFSCGQSNLYLIYGGKYNFYSCTLVDSNSAYISHTYPVVAFANYFRTNSPNALIAANFYNTIVYGDISNGDEIVGDSVTSAGFNYSFQNCLITTKTNTPSLHYIGTLLINQNPYFINPLDENYHLEGNSPCVGTGNPTFEPSDGLDLDGYSRSGSNDIGCYEYHK